MPARLAENDQMTIEEFLAFYDARPDGESGSSSRGLPSKRVHASVPNCLHYVTASAKRAEITRHDRESGWQGTTVQGLDATLSLTAIGVAIPLRTIYRWTEIE